MNSSKNINNFCSNLFNYKRRKSSECVIVDTNMGNENPIRVQSMTNTDTNNIDASVEQAIEMIKSGAQYVRLTAQGVKEAENLKFIKQALVERNYNCPLVADIHFNPNAAIVAAKYVDKIRINPGNFVDKPVSSKLSLPEKVNNDKAIQKIKDKFIPLLNVCKQHNTALRIGTNHGSLSERIMSQYGDTPRGMVEATMEFLRICKQENFPNVCISIKASNTVIMVKTVRLLVITMDKEDMNYPIHLGVTEAGEGEDGRIKSAVGTGALLNDGIGDTIRISLTEEPEIESPVAQKLVNYVLEKENHDTICEQDIDLVPLLDVFKRNILEVGPISNKKHAVVITDLSQNHVLTSDSPTLAGYIYDEDMLTWEKQETSADFVYISGFDAILTEYPEDLGIIVDQECWAQVSLYSANAYPMFTPDEFLTINMNIFQSDILFLKCKYTDLNIDLIEEIKKHTKVVLICESDHINAFAEQRAFIYKLINNKCKAPVILKRNFKETILEDLHIKSACDLGSLFFDGLANGIFLINTNESINTKDVRNTAFGILQAARVRTSKTEFVSCPSCGRTLFNLQKVAGEIKDKLSHLKHLKIGVMGCIVNGPGEMGDVDYGYVGSGKGKVSLYKGQELISKNIDSKIALEKLIELIKFNKDWIDA